MEDVISTDKVRIDFLAENLKRAMRVAKCSQEQLEAESGVSQATISRILNSKHDPAVSVVWRLAKALATSVDMLLAEPSEKKSQRSY